MSIEEERVFYFWSEGQVVKTGRVSMKYPDCPCIDTAYPGPHNRYGKFQPNAGWVHIPFDTFPPEFRAALMLMGIN